MQMPPECCGRIQIIAVCHRANTAFRKSTTRCNFRFARLEVTKETIIAT